jgi:hypothetical protein
VIDQANQALAEAYAVKAARRELREDLKKASYQDGLVMVAVLLSHSTPPRLRTLTIGNLLGMVNRMGKAKASTLLHQAGENGRLGPGGRRQGVPYEVPLGKLTVAERRAVIDQITRWVRYGSSRANYR